MTGRTLRSLGAVLLLGLLVRWAAASGTVTIHVDDGSACTAVCTGLCDAACAAGCGTPALPYRTIMAAVHDANCRIVAGQTPGATIQVAPGTYNETVLIYPNLHVRCEERATTIIDGAGLGRSAVIFTSGGFGRPRVDFSIDGCTITRGSGEDRPADATVAGGGVFVFGDAVVSNNLITGNVLSGSQSSWLGAGIYVAYGDPILTGNVISRNVADPPPLGGQNDSRALGAGIFVLGSLKPVDTHVRIEGNTLADNQALGEIGRGGGIRVDGNPGTLVTRNIIAGNRATYGGGGLQIYGTVAASDNLIFGNSGGMWGGGVQLYQAVARVTNNTIAGNSLTDTRAPTGYSFGNYGAGVQVGALIPQWQDPQVHITNTIIMGNTVTSVGSGGGLHSYNTNPITTYSDFWSNLKLPAAGDNVGGDFTEAQLMGMPGNLAADPRFVRAPLFLDVTVAAGSATTVAVTAAARYAIGQGIEYNDDGVRRSITAINTSSNVLTFTPALPAASQPWKMIGNWGGATDLAEDFRLATGSPLADRGTNAGVGPFDLAELPRLQDNDDDGTATADLGAYEGPAPDADGDGVLNDQDCAPGVGSVWTIPAPLGPTLRAAAGTPATFAWLKLPQANVYNVYRGSVDRVFENHVCFEAASPDRVSPDPAAPAPGTAFYYLVSGRNACGEGSLGTDSAGVPRPNLNPCPLPYADGDGDLIRDADDNCPLAANTAQIDTDRDGAGDGCDNCLLVLNPDQSDIDADGIGDACEAVDADLDGFPVTEDCNDTDGSIWRIPGEVPLLDLPAATSLSWAPPTDPGGTVVRYDLLRSGVRSDFVDGAVCVASDITQTGAADAAVPAAGQGFFYLARAQNGCPIGQGTLGNRSDGSERAGRSCP
ncbi:MAG: hypothetical protein ACRD6R_10880 [Candidatus Polarisedimenticolia bacterium]